MKTNRRTKIFYALVEVKNRRSPVLFFGRTMDELEKDIAAFKSLPVGKKFPPQDLLSVFTVEGA